jgi:glycosyltransferase involved in cell wall biosynthesis
MRVTILQRIVPHYRLELFRRINQRLGWNVVSGRSDKDGSIPLVSDQSWLHQYDFGLDEEHVYRARVPLRQILRDLPTDAVIAEFSPQISATWQLSAQAAASRGPRLVYWSQGWNVERGFRNPVDLASQALRLMLMRPADAQLCYTEAGAAYLRRWLPTRQSIFVAPNTVNIEGYESRDIDRSPDDPRRANLLFVGRMTPDKNVPMLIQAFARARQTLPDIRLTIIGDGPDMTAVRKATAAAPAGITLRGSLYEPAEIAAEFQQASLFVYGGSIGLAANQALAYGIPIMLFDRPRTGLHHPEHEYVVDDVTGYRVAPPTAAELAARIVDVLSGATTPRRHLAVPLKTFVDDRLKIDRMVDGFAMVAALLERIGPRRGVAA